MKPSSTALAASANITTVKTTGDLRTLVSNHLLALARGETGPTNLEAMAKALDSISNSLNTELKIAKAKIDVRELAANLGKETNLGDMLIGGSAA